MRYQKVFVNALAYALPDEVVSTRALEEALQPVYSALRIPSGQLEALTGIRERRWWPEGFRVSDGALMAARKAMHSLDLPASSIDTLVYAGVCRDQHEPATACRVASELNLGDHAVLFDLSNACLGVLNGMIEVANRIELGQASIGMVVSCESSRDINLDTLRRLTQQPDLQDLKDNLATFTGGSGAVAVVLSRYPDLGQAHRLLGGSIRNEHRYHDLCRWGLRRVREHLMEQYLITDAIQVMKHGVALGLKTWQAFLEELQWRPEQIARVISHQVGSAHRRTVLASLGLHESKDFASFPNLGNIGTVSLPLTAALAEEQGFLQAGDQVAWLGIGSGLNCMMLGLEW